MSIMDDLCKEFAREVGRDAPDRAWILTPHDSWYRNPFYTGPEERHPEDQDEQDRLLIELGDDFDDEQVELACRNYVGP
jgi:hypothetical protein